MCPQKCKSRLRLLVSMRLVKQAGLTGGTGGVRLAGNSGCPRLTRNEDVTPEMAIPAATPRRQTTGRPGWPAVAVRPG